MQVGISVLEGVFPHMHATLCATHELKFGKGLQIFEAGDAAFKSTDKRPQSDVSIKLLWRILCHNSQKSSRY